MKNQAFQSKNPRNSAPNHQSGNVMILILIAVALFGAISFAMMQGSRVGTGTISGEQAKIAASEMIQYAQNIKNAVKSLKINGCSDNQISFEGTGLAASYVNGSSSAKCQVFNSSGGGANYIKPNPDWLEMSTSAQPQYGQYVFTGMHWINGVGTSVNNASLTDKEIMLVLPYVTRQVCIEINKILNVKNDGAGDGPPLDNTAGVAFNVSNLFAGTFTAGTQLDSGSSGSGTEIDGKQAACVQGMITGASGGPYYGFYTVLVAR